LPEVALELRPEVVTSFVKMYGEKQKISLELTSLQKRVRKRKISRRRYKVRRKTLETRLNVLSKTLTAYREQMLAAGGKYRAFIRQLNVAENRINKLEANIKRVESRHRLGELSLQDYRKRLAEYERNKEDVESEISGILLRLSE
jgi:chromosome segregation ATPase